MYPANMNNQKKSDVLMQLLQPVFAGLFVLSIITNISLIAKSNPRNGDERVIAFKRAASLDHGISVSWLEQTWAKDIFADNALTDADFVLLKRLGFKSIRIPIAFEFFEEQGIPAERVLTVIDDLIKKCHTYGFKLLLDYHGGKMDDGNYVAETNRAINTWSLVAKRYALQDADNLLYELYNEPPHIDPQHWKDAAYNITNALRKIDSKKTFIIGASNYNSIYELSRMVRLADNNIIYTFHFYEPFLFTHQGAEWIGDQVATTGIPFPYNAENFPQINDRAKGTAGQSNYEKYHNDGNEQSVLDKLTMIKQWGQKYDVPLLCGEYGVYNKYADKGSRCRYINAVRLALKKLNIPGMLWDYNSNFSVFEGKPGLDTLPDCMKQALGLTP
jgi:endoglucanase